MTLRRSDLLFKVGNAARIVKDSIPDEDKTHEMRRWVEDILDDGNSERVTDLLDLAFADILEWMDTHLQDVDTEGDVDVDEDDDYIFRVSARLGAHKAILKPRFEEYMVAYVLWQWLLHKGFESQAAPWLAEMELMREKVRDVINGGRMKRPMSPF